MLFECVCVFNLLQDIHQFALRQIDVYLSQARAQKNTHHYLLITPHILIQILITPPNPLYRPINTLYPRTETTIGVMTFEIPRH